MVTAVALCVYSKFLDPYRITNLVTYLEKIKERGIAAAVCSFVGSCSLPLTIRLSVLCCRITLRC